MTEYQQIAVRHLLLRLGPLHARCRDAVRKRMEFNQSLGSEGATPYDHVAVAVANAITEPLRPDAPPGTPVELPLDPPDFARQAQLADEAGCSLPLQLLNDRFKNPPLTKVELVAILACAAPEVEPEFARLYTYLHDDRNRRNASVELIARLFELSAHARVALLRELDRNGRLRRYGMLVPVDPDSSDMRQGLALAPDVFAFLCGATVSPASWHDPAEVAAGDTSTIDPDLLTELDNEAAAADKRPVWAVGLWGLDATRREAAAERFAGKAGRRCRRLLPGALPSQSFDPCAVRDAVQSAGVLDSALLVSLDRLADNPSLSAALGDLARRLRVPVILHGDTPCPPAWAARADGYHEWTLRTPKPVAKGGTTSRATAEETPAPELPQPHGRFLTLVRPRRKPEDLILLPDLHKQVMEVADFFRALPAVAGEMGFASRVTGGNGLKVLMVGEPGTGKTLAAEVIASKLELPLLKLNAGRLASKWVGEMEERTDEAFDQAHNCRGLLFIDECDAACAKRGEVRYGGDQHANREVMHLMGRLDEFDGPILMATNLRENMDPAFLRRVHITINFPRPQLAERVRLWEWALKDAAEPGLNVSALARPEMTGAAIVSAARLAALTAVSRRKLKVGPEEAVKAVCRQLRREGRIVNGDDFGEYKKHAAV